MQYSNKRIVKNTVLLYIRMTIILLISLYSSRILLKILGVEDYGIYNIIGGVVVLFSFLNNAMVNATQRYLNFSIGKGNENHVHKVFCVSMIVHFSIAGLVLLLAETIGLWFVNSQLNIPFERMHAANYVYQLSIAVTCINIIKVPYNAVIIAYEKMAFFAYISIVEAVLKLVIIFLLIITPFDNLMRYSLYLFVISVFVLVVYWIYCRKNYKVCRFIWMREVSLYKEMIQFAGWYLFGGIAVVGTRQGINILLNVFCGVALNAAVGVANQVKNAIYSFITSFQTATNPQLVQLYATGASEQFFELISRATKFSFFLFFIISFPVILVCEELLDIWLVVVPPYTVVFTQLTIISTFVDVVSAPLCTAMGATGRIKTYQLIVSFILLLDLPLSLYILRMGASPVYVYVINILVAIWTLIFRIVFILRKMNFGIRIYLKNALMPCLFVLLLSLPVPVTYNYICNSMWLFSLFLSIFFSCLSIYFVGLSKDEKKIVSLKIKQYISNHS